MSELWQAEAMQLSGNEPKLVLSVARAPSDADESSDAFQRELRQLEQGLRGAGVQIAPRALVRKSAGGGALLTGDFLVAAQTLGPAAFTFLGVWIQSRLGRKARIKMGDVEVEATTSKEAERLLERVRALQAHDAPKP